MTGPLLFTVRIQQKLTLAEDIIGLTLVSPDGSLLPEFEAGAHIDIHLANGMVRQYSLCNSPAQRDHYQLGILLDPLSRGGSLAIHQTLQAGDTLTISAPRNLFPLQPSPRYRLFAGGIGITPILAMAESLQRQGQDFELHYCARSRSRAAFVDRLQTAAFASRVQLHFDDDPTTAPLDAPALLANPDSSHLYVCGPEGFIRHLTETAKACLWATTQVHYEQFSAPVTNHEALSNRHAFELQLASSGQIIPVSADQSAAQALIAAGVPVAISCEQGICGSCLTAVIDGEPDHQDYFQTEAEKATNNRFTPCCSRAKSRRLVLDI
tara:strand:+ start:4386 stop:5357 length:972 start_codon:yes stop_codon:yes gene_type:complete